jgi:acetyl-CoA acyltransferase
MTDAYICDGVRTPIGRYAGALSAIRADDLAALPIAALISRNTAVDWSQLDDVILGCANQAGEDSRNVARMAALLAGLPVTVPGVTINRLCGSGLDAVGTAARAIRSGDCAMIIAGGVESMTRAPFVIGKATSAFSRNAEIYDTTIGWRFSNPKLARDHGTHSMPETADNVAAEFKISRSDQDAFALRSQSRWAEAHRTGRFEEEIVPVIIPQKRGDPLVIREDEHPRPDTTFAQLGRLPGINGSDLTVTWTAPLRVDRSD